MADDISAVLEWKLGLLPTGNVLFEIGHATSLEDALDGRIQ